MSANDMAKQSIMNPAPEETVAALRRLFPIALRDTGQSRRVADFLLAWHNAEENGGWDPVDLWNVDAEIAEDMLTVLGFLRHVHRYPDGLGFQKEIEAVWEQWRANGAPSADLLELGEEFT